MKLNPKPAIVPIVGVVAVMLVTILGIGAVHMANIKSAGTSGPSDPTSRTGTVVAVPAPTASLVWVDMGGPEPVDLPYLNTYVPVPGDQVEVLFRSVNGNMQGLVLGGRAGQSGNLIPNGDFRAQSQLSLATINTPYMWNFYHASGGAAHSFVFGALDSVHTATSGQPVMIVTTDIQLASDDYAYSAAVQTHPGEKFSVDALWNVSTNSPPGCNIYLMAGFFAGAEDLWPAAMSTTVIDTDNLTSPVAVGGFTQWQSGQITVPAGANYVRIAMRGEVTGGSGLGGGYTLIVFQVQMRRP